MKVQDRRSSSYEDDSWANDGSIKHAAWLRYAAILTSVVGLAYLLHAAFLSQRTVLVRDGVMPLPQIANDMVPTAVVLADFSASIQGPSSALWSMSIAAIVIGALVVQRRYRNY